ncbi:hypothetical protein [Neisseria elongata]|uniref:hypothetical protein n=1 Tax=Neisseria elongata TaxID=495 RepID=UPI0028D26963|nr:hypothetical protein [Neisseria elongata]
MRRVTGLSATLRIQIESKKGILNGILPAHGVREYKPDGSSSIHSGGAKASFKTQMGGCMMFEWDFWNGGKKHEYKLK